MHRMDSTDAAANVLRTSFPAVLLLCLAVSGCGYSCYAGFWNGNQSGAGFSNTSCPLTKAMGAVTVQMSAASAASAAIPSPLASPNNVEHIFVTLRGIEAHPSELADTDWPGWQELVPDLATHPVQLDLLAPMALAGDSGLLGSPVRANIQATIPADEYRQLRIRVAPFDPSPGDPLPESNACGIVGWNCIVFADGSARPWQFDNTTAEFRITSEHSTDGLFRVLPGEVIQLSIEFDPSPSVFFTSKAAVRLVPIFRVASRASSSSSNTQ